MSKMFITMLLIVFVVATLGCTNKDSAQEVVTMLINQTNQEKLQPLIDQFMVENPHVTVEIEGVKFTEIDQKTNLAHASGNGYDIIMINHTAIPQFVGGGVLDDLTPYLQDSTINLEKSFNKSNYDIANIGGGQYAIPYEPDVRVLAYNKHLIDELGVDAPTTPEEILALGPAMRDIGAYVYGMDWKNRWEPIYVTGCFMLSMGAHVYTKDGDTFTATCTTPEMLEYVQWVKDIYEFMPQDVSVNQDQLRELFSQDKLAFYVWGPWENSMRIAESGVEYGLTMIPTTGTTSSAMGGWLLGMGNNGRDKSTAWSVVEYLYKPEHMASISLALSPTKEAFAYAPFNDKEVYGIFEEQMVTAQIPVAPVANTSKIAEVYFSYFQQAVTGAMPVADAMNKAQIEIEKLLEVQ